MATTAATAAMAADEFHRSVLDRVSRMAISSPVPASMQATAATPNHDRDSRQIFSSLEEEAAAPAGQTTPKMGSLSSRHHGDSRPEACARHVSIGDDCDHDCGDCRGAASMSTPAPPMMMTMTTPRTPCQTPLPPRGPSAPIPAAAARQAKVAAATAGHKRRVTPDEACRLPPATGGGSPFEPAFEGSTPPLCFRDSTTHSTMTTQADAQDRMEALAGLLPALTPPLLVPAGGESAPKGGGSGCGSTEAGQSQSQSGEVLRPRPRKRRNVGHRRSGGAFCGSTDLCAALGGDAALGLPPMLSQPRLAEFPDAGCALERRRKDARARSPVPSGAAIFAPIETPHSNALTMSMSQSMSQSMSRLSPRPGLSPRPAGHSQRGHRQGGGSRSPRLSPPPINNIYDDRLARLASSTKKRCSTPVVTEGESGSSSPELSPNPSSMSSSAFSLGNLPFAPAFSVGTSNNGDTTHPLKRGSSSKGSRQRRQQRGTKPRGLKMRMSGQQRHRPLSPAGNSSFAAAFGPGRARTVSSSSIGGLNEVESSPSEGEGSRSPLVPLF